MVPIHLVSLGQARSAACVAQIEVGILDFLSNRWLSLDDCLASRISFNQALINSIKNSSLELVVKIHRGLALVELEVLHFIKNGLRLRCSQEEVFRFLFAVRIRLPALAVKKEMHSR